MDVHAYLNQVYEVMLKRNPHEEEFHLAIRELFDSLPFLLVKEPH